MKKKPRQRIHKQDRFKTTRKNKDGTRETESRLVAVSPRTNKEIYC